MGNGPGRNLSKEALRKMRYKHDIWRVCKHNNDKDYEGYKEELNVATNEFVKHRLAHNIKSDSKSFYA